MGDGRCGGRGGLVIAFADDQLCFILSMREAYLTDTDDLMNAL